MHIQDKETSSFPQSVQNQTRVFLPYGQVLHPYTPAVDSEELLPNLYPEVDVLRI